MVRDRPRLLVALATLVVLLAACGGGGGGGSDVAGAGGGTPSFTADSLAGGEVDSASFAGKPTVLWFWAPWCTICRAEAPAVAAAAEANADEVTFVGVAGRGEVPAMEDFTFDTGTGGLTHVVDDDGSIWADFGVVAQPAFAFISPDGSVETVQGSLDEQEITERMQALAA